MVAVMHCCKGHIFPLIFFKNYILCFDFISTTLRIPSLEHLQPVLSSHPILSFQKTTFSIIQYNFTIFSAS